MTRFTDRIDMRFQYTPASKTDIRKTFARELHRLAEEKRNREADEAEAVGKVRKLKQEQTR